MLAVLLAVTNNEIALACNERTQLGFDVVNPGERRRLRDQVADEGVNLALHLDQHAVLVVQGKAGETWRIASRQTCGRKPPLHQAADTQTQATRSDGTAPWPMSKSTRASMRNLPLTR